MAEKVSSEIAESRERFEKWACNHFGSGNDSIFMSRDPQFPYTYAQTSVHEAWQGWQGATGDTRERCALFLEVEAERLYHAGLGSQMDIAADHLRKVAERIRGKE